MKKTCPRCGSEFSCLHDEMLSAYAKGEPMPTCDCMRVSLTAQQRNILSQQYGAECLCYHCLRDFSMIPPTQESII